MARNLRSEGPRGNRSEALLDSVPDALLVLDARGRVIRANAAAAQLFGHQPHELAGRHPQSLLSDGFDEFLAEARARFGSGSSPVRLDSDARWSVRDCDGVVVPVELTLAPMRDRGVGEVVVSLRDVRHRQQGESELRHAIALVNATLESTADGILVVSTDGRIAGSNHQFASMWGIPSALLESQDDDRVMAFVLDQLVDAGAFVAKVHELYDHPEDESNDVLEFRDGRIFERYSRPQRIGEDVVGRVWSFRDVTERERAQEETRDALARLSSADSRFRSLVESSDDSIVSTTPDGLITSWNAAAERLFGYPAAEIVGRSLSVLIPGDRHRRAQEVHRRAMEEGLTRRNLEADAVRRDGSVVAVSLTVSPIYDGTATVGVSAIIRDITEARARERELVATKAEAEAASRAKSEFLATMSHEIRTPMNGVIGLTGLLLNTRLDETQRRYAAGVRGAGEALLGIIDDILDFSKLEAGKIDLEEVSFSPSEVVHEVGVLLASSASAQGLEFRTECAPDVPEVVVGDPGRLRQVLINLAGNAVKFTDRGSVVVRVTTLHRETAGTPPGATLRFEVCDTGIGIDPLNQARLFEPFAQADASTTRRYGGTGLGLAISRRLVDAMGGHLMVSSEVDVGSTFGFALSLQVAGSAAATSASPTRSSSPVPGVRTDTARATGRRVLVAEDNQVNQMVALGVLTELGYDAHVVGDGRQALLAMQEGDFAAILMDVHMPVMDGFEATRELRRREAGGRRTPIIAMTAGVLDEDRDRCLAAGMDGFVAKPVDVELLRRALDGCLAALAPPRSVLDPERLATLRGLGPDDGLGLLPAVVGAFLDTSEMEIAELDIAWDAADAAAAARLVHSLKGACANLGASEAAAVCGEVEGIVRGSGRLPGPEVRERLDVALVEARTALGEQLEASPGAAGEPV